MRGKGTGVGFVREKTLHKADIVVILFSRIVACGSRVIGG